MVRWNKTLEQWPSLDGADEATVLRALASVKFPHGMIDRITEDKGSAKPIDTNGRWFRLSFTHRVLDSFFSDEKLWNTKNTNWQRAFHGTALHNLPNIVTRGLETGPNALPNARGNYRAQTYVEGDKRKHCAFMYSTHVAVEHCNPCWWFGSVLEVFVDRNRGGTAHDQWRQDHGSVHLTAAWIHICDIRKAYEKDYVGTMRLSLSQYEDGIKSLADDDKVKPEDGMNLTLRDAMEYRIARHTKRECPSPLKTKKQPQGPTLRKQETDAANAEGSSAVRPKQDTAKVASSSKAVPAKARPGTPSPPWRRGKSEKEPVKASEIVITSQSEEVPSGSSASKSAPMRIEGSRSTLKDPTNRTKHSASAGSGDAPWRKPRADTPGGSRLDPIPLPVSFPNDGSIPRSSRTPSPLNRDDVVNIFRKRPK
jgi:hypothetical protein